MLKRVEIKKALHHAKALHANLGSSIRKLECDDWDISLYLTSEVIGSVDGGRKQEQWNSARSSEFLWVVSEKVSEDQINW